MKRPAAWIRHRKTFHIDTTGVPPDRGIMTDPPTPTLTAYFLAALAGQTWTFVKNDPTGTALGVFTSAAAGAAAPAVHHIGATHGGPDGLWATSTTLSAGFGVILLSRDTAALLQGGVVQTDGRMLYSGAYFKVASYYDGAQWTARAVTA